MATTLGGVRHSNRGLQLDSAGPVDFAMFLPLTLPQQVWAGLCVAVPTLCVMFVSVQLLIRTSRWRRVNRRMSEITRIDLFAEPLLRSHVAVEELSRCASRDDVLQADVVARSSSAASLEMLQTPTPPRPLTSTASFYGDHRTSTPVLPTEDHKGSATRRYSQGAAHPSENTAASARDAAGVDTPAGSVVRVTVDGVGPTSTTRPRYTLQPAVTCLIARRDMKQLGVFQEGVGLIKADVRSAAVLQAVQCASRHYPTTHTSHTRDTPESSVLVLPAAARLMLWKGLVRRHASTCGTAADIPRSVASPRGASGDGKHDEESSGGAARQAALVRVDCERMTSPQFKEHGAREALIRVVLRWTRCHPDNEYRQGFSSIAAVVLSVVNHAVATGAPGFDAEHDTVDDVVADLLNHVTAAFLPGAFLDGDRSFLNARMVQLRHLLGFWDPELALCLDDLGLSPVMFAQSWMECLFAHSTRLPVAVSLWDVMLSCDERFPLFLGVALLAQVCVCVCVWGALWLLPDPRTDMLLCVVGGADPRTTLAVQRPACRVAAHRAPPLWPVGH